jgi:hypothetical protein
MCFFPLPGWRGILAFVHPVDGAVSSHMWCANSSAAALWKWKFDCLGGREADPDDWPETPRPCISRPAHSHHRRRHPKDGLHESGNNFAVRRKVQCNASVTGRTSNTLFLHSSFPP